MQNHSYASPTILPKPGWPGRVIRFVLGALVLNGAFGIGAGFRSLVYDRQPPENIGLWVFAVLLFLSMPHVINLGLSVQWGQKAQIATLILSGACIAADAVFYKRIWAPPVGLLLCIWCLLIAIPLGVALVLAAIFATPGCEMRTYAALLARLQGRSATEHYCPGGIDFIDRWAPHLKRS